MRKSLYYQIKVCFCHFCFVVVLVVIHDIDITVFVIVLELALDLYVNFSMCPCVRLYVCVYFRSFFQGFLLGDILNSGNGSGTLLIKLNVLSLATQCHTQFF